MSRADVKGLGLGYPALLLSAFLVVAAMFVVPGAAWAATADTLSAEQESLARSLEGELIAPCCYTQTVAEHDSEKAEEIKAQIRSLVASGSDKGEILGFFKERYGSQILAAPEKSGFGLMAYLFPTLATLVALGAILFVIQRWRRRDESAVAVPIPVNREGSDQARARLDEELRRFDD